MIRNIFKIVEIYRNVKIWGVCILIWRNYNCIEKKFYNNGLFYGEKDEYIVKVKKKI